MRRLAARINPQAARIGCAFLFFNNYVDVATWGSFTLSLCWSNAVEVQCSLVLFLLVAAARGGGGGVGGGGGGGVVDEASSVKLASRLRVVFLLAFFSSIGIW